ncbi:MAG: hypothetical protein HN849_26155 [Victivallales bacterium]|nr:hypothetical protein [Victivallales bacterium]
MQVPNADRSRTAVARFLALGLLLMLAGCVTGRLRPGAALSPGAVPAGAHIVHVAFDGDDGNAGTTEAPFATLAKARDALRAKRAAGSVGDAPMVVQLHGGVYRITETLTLGKEDSGTAAAPVVWMAVPGETVRLVGGVRLGTWGAITDPAVRERLPENARANVREADLAALGVTDFGTVKPGTGRAEVFFNGSYLTLARYPNGGFVRIANVPEEAKKARPVSDPKRPDLNRHAGPINYAGDRPEGWSSTKGVWVHGYWYHDWSDQLHEVLKFDFERKELWPKPPYHGYGYKRGQRYYYLNVLDELDEPGEWYLDRSTGKLYLWPPAPIEDAEVLFPDLAKPMVTMENVEHVSFRGIVFECSRAGAVVVKGGASCDISGCVVRNVGGTGIDIRGGTHHTVRSCDIYEVASTGIYLNGGDRKTLARGDHAVENCHIHHFARVQKTYRPAVSLQGVGNRISHSYIHDCPHEGIGYSGNDHTIEFTEFTRVARETGDVGAIYAAMDWTYTGHTFRHNYFHRIHGPGKLGCFTVYPDLPCGGVHLYGNIFYDVDQIFHTNSGRGMVMENNIFLRAKRGMSFSTWGDMKKFQMGGNWRMVERLAEVKYDQPPYSTRYPVLARLAEDFAKGDEHVYQRAIPKDNMVRRNISQGESFFLRVSGKAGLQDVQVEQNYIADPVVLLGSPTGDAKGGTYRSDDERIRTILAKSGNVVNAEDPGFVDPENGDFRLKPGSPAAVIGFKPIPFAQIGLRRDEYRLRLPDPLPKPPAAPILRPDGGYFSGAVEVTIKAGSADAELRYTLDGTEPSRESPLVSGPIRLTKSASVTCAAFPPFGRAVDRSPAVTAKYYLSGHLEDGVCLSALPLAAKFIGYEPMGLLRDVAHGGNPIGLGGQTYQQGLITHPAELPDGNRACAEFALDGPLRKARRFTTIVGIEDQAPRDKPGHGTCGFIVEIHRKGTWQRVFESEVMKPGDEPRKVDVDVAGADRLRLIATDGGDSIAWDHAAWGNPVLR